MTSPILLTDFISAHVRSEESARQVLVLADDGFLDLKGMVQALRGRPAFNIWLKECHDGRSSGSAPAAWEHRLALLRRLVAAGLSPWQGAEPDDPVMAQDIAVEVVDRLVHNHQSELLAEWLARPDAPTGKDLDEAASRRYDAPVTVSAATDIDTLRVLLEHGCSPHQAGKHKGMVLVACASPAHADLLLAHGLDITRRSADGGTAATSWSTYADNYLPMMSWWHRQVSPELMAEALPLQSLSIFQDILKATGQSPEAMSPGTLMRMVQTSLVQKLNASHRTSRVDASKPMLGTELFDWIMQVDPPERSPQEARRLGLILLALEGQKTIGKLRRRLTKAFRERPSPPDTPEVIASLGLDEFWVKAIRGAWASHEIWQLPTENSSTQEAKWADWTRQGTHPDVARWLPWAMQHTDLGRRYGIPLLVKDDKWLNLPIDPWEVVFPSLLESTRIKRNVIGNGWDANGLQKGNMAAPLVMFALSRAPLREDVLAHWKPIVEAARPYIKDDFWTKLQVHMTSSTLQEGLSAIRTEVSRRLRL